MRKKLFFGVSFVVFISLMVAWQIAAAEIAALQGETEKPSVSQNSDLVYTSHFSKNTDRPTLQ